MAEEVFQRLEVIDSQNLINLIKALDSRYIVGKASNIKFGIVKLYDSFGDNEDGTVTQKTITSMIATAYRYKGSVERYTDLPSKKEVGDVYNITNSDDSVGIRAGDNVAWNGTNWDNLSGFVDLSAFLKKNGQYIKDVVFQSNTKTLIFELPDGTTKTVLIPSGLDSKSDEVSDINLVLTTGVYPIVDIVNTEGVPIAETGTLFVFSDVIYTHQQYFTTKGNLLIRSYTHVNETWSNWYSVINSSSISAYAPLNSPSFTGTPTTTNPTVGDSTTRVATTKFVMEAIANLVNSSPESLDTLNELAQAINNDPNFATTVLNRVAEKLPLAGGTITGNLTVDGTLKMNTPAKIGLTGGATASPVDFTGDSDITLSVSALNMDNANAGTLSVSRGGTGLSDNPSVLVNLGSTNASDIFAVAPRPGVTGILSTNNGGTGQSALSSVTVGKATNLETSRIIDGVSFNGSGNVNHYAVCSTPAATVEKIVSCSGFSLSTGARITIKFAVTNTADNPTLNVNNTGAKAIYYRGYAIVASALQVNSIYDFIYDGIYYQIVGSVLWTD